MLVTFEGLPQGLAKRLIADSHKAIKKGIGRQDGPGQLRTQVRPMFKTTYIKDAEGNDTDEVDEVANYILVRMLAGDEELELANIEATVAEKTNTDVNSIKGKLTATIYKNAEEAQEGISTDPRWNGETV
jgi:hypothetical protein